MQNQAVSTHREKVKREFLVNYFGTDDFAAHQLPQDASFRSYTRIRHQGESFILMDSPPEIYSVVPFINVARFLAEYGFSAPQIYDIEEKEGFLLLEDFGTLSAARHLSANDQAEEARLYELAMDLLLALQQITPPKDFACHTNNLLLEELQVFTEWYRPKGEEISTMLKEDFFEAWGKVLSFMPELSRGLVLKDYHAENIMILDRPGINALGLLDFQDAVIGSPVYDLVSVLEDARRDVDISMIQKHLEYYVSKVAFAPKSDIVLAYHILGAQRNLRILGVFVRKALRDGNNNYLQYLPRVTKYVQHDLSHPKLSALKKVVECLLV